MKLLSFLLQRLYPAVAALLAVSGTVSCLSEPAGAPAGKTGRSSAHFSVVVDDIKELVQTKSVLTDDSIETKISSITVAVYASDGSLVEKSYLTSGFDDIRYMLGFDETFRIYALANMGDMRAAFPSSISGDASLEAITYSIPGYTSADVGINARGIPMAGKLVYTVSDGTAARDGQIVMTRLMSKLQVHLTCNWPGTFRTVRIYNLNRTLKPFGISAAASSGDILSEQEIDILDADAKEGDFLFYIPENMQGNVSGITGSEGRSRDNDNVPGRDLKTYLEAVVTGVSGDGVNGNMTYRSYLGGNASSNFDILRNSRYVWNIQYLPGHLQNNDWKHQNALSWKEFEYNFSAPSYLYLGERNNATLSAYASQYENGAFVQRKLDNNTGIPSITYSVTPADGSVLGNTSVGNPYFYFTGVGSGTGTVQATCVDPFHPEGVKLSKDVQVLNYGRQIFLRTPIGDFYDGDVIPIPYGTTWDEIKVGMKKTRANGTVQTVCPIVINSDNLFAGSVYYPSYGSRYAMLDYTASTGGAGKPLVFSHTFTEGRISAYELNLFRMFCYYKDYNNELHQLVAYIGVQNLDSDTEIIAVSADKSEADWSGGSISLTARSTTVHNGASGSQKDITASNDYRWTATGSVSGMNPQLTLSGNTRVLTAAKAGTVTVTVTKKSDGSVSGSKTVTFSDQVSYRLNITPKTWNVKVGDTFQTDVFTINQDKYVNGVYRSSEPFTGLVIWYVKNGSSPYLSTATTIHPVTVRAKAEGTGYLRAYTTSATIESGYTENEITVNIGQSDNYTVSLSPASLSVQEGGNAQALAFDVRNNGAPVAALAASDLLWHTRNSAVATVSGGVVSGKSAGSTKVYASYGGATSNEVDVTVTPSEVTRYKVVTTVTPSAIKLGQTAAASAIRYKQTVANGTPVSAWVADGDVTSSGFMDVGNSGKVSFSGSTVSAVSTGSVTIRSRYDADAYEDATLSISSADYAVSVSPAAGADLILGKKTSQVYTAGATMNGNAASDGSFEWSLAPSGKASLSTSTGSSVTVTALAFGNATLTVNYKVGGEVKATASVAFTVFDNSLELSLDKSTLPVNGNTKATVTFRSNGSPSAVTGSATIRAYTSASGSTQSSKVLIGADGNITGKEGGDCWLEASYAKDGYTYTSDRVKVTVSMNPLQLNWSSEGAAGYVAQQGLLEVGGLDDASASVNYVVTSGADKVRLTPAGKNAYVGLTGSGSYTIKATASNGQEGTFSGTVSAPSLSLNASTLYANPDGSAAHTGEDGLSGSTLEASYKAGAASLAVTTSTIAVGNNLNKTLYDELLAPSYSAASGSCLAAGNGGIYAARLHSPEYPAAGGVDIGTVTVSPKASSTGVTPVQITVRSVDPFSGLGQYRRNWAAFADKEMISKYVECDAVSRSHQLPSPAVRASSSAVGWDVSIDGSPNAVMQSRFSYDGTYVRFQYDEGDALPHIGGDCSFRLTVTNSHSLEKLACAVVEFPVVVFGAVGGIPVVNGSSTFGVKAGYVGPEVVRPSFCSFSTSYKNEETVDVYVGSTANGQKRSGKVSLVEQNASLDRIIYNVTTNNGESVLNINHVYKSLSPGLVVNGSVPKECAAYYVILNLESEQSKVIHSDFKPGWIIPD